MTNQSKPNGTIIPHLIYNDVAKAMDWLCDVFGFTERLRAGGGGQISHAQLAIGQGGVILGESRIGAGFAAPDQTVFRPPRQDEVSVSTTVQVDDVDAHYEHAKQRGARTLSTPTTYPFGERQYTAPDLEGHRWTFTQSVADVKPEDWGATVTEVKNLLAVLPRPRFCYMEIPATDLAQSVAFYERVFGWNIRHRESGRPSFDDAAHISGAWVMDRPPSREPGLLPYIWVDSIDATVAKVVENGGQIVKEVQPDSPGGEWIATFRDPAGNLLGLYQEGRR